MIKSLSIKNYALIRELEMSPDSHLNIITGETGAGKSIMLGAVGLLLGSRSESKVLLNDNEKCVVEGTFDISDYKLQPTFENEDIEFDNECVIRREISPAGKSRAFINDTPTTLPVLKRIGENLMDVHSQHESLQLGNNAYQLEVLDAFASHHSLLNSFEKAFHDYDRARKRLEQLEKKAAESTEDAEYKQFLLNELLEAGLDEINKEELKSELKVTENAEDIRQKLAQSIDMLDESEIAILQRLSEVKLLLSSLANYSTDLSQVSERIESASIELRDLTNEIQQIQENVDYDPERAQEIKEQIDLIHRLEKKHHVLTVEELIEIRNKLDEELRTSMNLEDEVRKAKNEFSILEGEMNSAGEKLSESRRLSALNFADEIEKIVRRIGIENGTIEILLRPATPNKTGLDTVEILFSANKGVKAQELKEVASGGEFSRLIFAIKYLIADKTALPTIIFDEVETGVSGEVAIQMINMMKEMAKNHQIISISHLPQFAAGGDAHFFVYKDHSSERSVSKMKKLNTEERITEIAKMIGGEHPGNSAVESARELLRLS
ncbi:MAG: DNA repair protein RecN [Ekhidna sp.]|nr:DNA repair protein RecN [Ekhidna sp.]